MPGGSPTPPVGRPGHLNGGQGPPTSAFHAREGHRSSTEHIWKGPLGTMGRARCQGVAGATSQGQSAGRCKVPILSTEDAAAQGWLAINKRISNDSRWSRISMCGSTVSPSRCHQAGIPHNRWAGPRNICGESIPPSGCGVAGIGVFHVHPPARSHSLTHSAALGAPLGWTCLATL